ncbi:hypothetical protein LEP1GSC150_4569 [Leptospira interrogans serovar Copenhageni str. LT2050]|uniref:Uncharacterized protein n=1 Tax=Leptospira interrogans serovar Copenhageni str. LT2050 TaxID=1001598 RepID=M3G6D3_LEPIT|nr:hypothetical protein LEP1GSC150_4569 [Leptospira interrogans serovar Copenhageni str. LT2050]
MCAFFFLSYGFFQKSDTLLQKDSKTQETETKRTGSFQNESPRKINRTYSNRLFFVLNSKVHFILPFKKNPSFYFCLFALGCFYLYFGD